MTPVNILKTGLVLFNFALAASCTKKDIISPPADAQNRILSYKISSVSEGEQPVIGAVDDSDSTITVYLPSYLLLQVITPDIVVSEGATVTPSTGSVIENLVSIIQTKQTVSYKVTGKNGSVRTYTLRIVSQQPQTVVNELTPDGVEPTTFTVEGFVNIGFMGQNFVIDNRPNLIKVVFTDEQGTVLPALYAQDDFLATTSTSFTLQIVRVLNTEFISKLPATGLYKVTIYNYGQIVTLKNPIRISNKPA